MTETVLRGQPNGAAPSPFRIAARHKWLPFESPDAEEAVLYAGFAAKLRMPTYGELLAETEALADSEAAFFTLAGPRIVAWNALAVDDDGAESPIPAPGDHPDNWRAVYALERPLVSWLLVALRTAHHSDTQRDDLKKRLAALREPGSARHSERTSSASPGDE